MPCTCIVSFLRTVFAWLVLPFVVFIAKQSICIRAGPSRFAPMRALFIQICKHWIFEGWEIYHKWNRTSIITSVATRIFPNSFTFRTIHSPRRRVDAKEGLVHLIYTSEICHVRHQTLHHCNVRPWQVQRGETICDRVVDRGSIHVWRCRPNGNPLWGYSTRTMYANTSLIFISAICSLTAKSNLQQVVNVAPNEPCTPFIQAMVSSCISLNSSWSDANTKWLYAVVPDIA